MGESQNYGKMPPFTGRNVPVTEIARAMHKDAQYVRVGLQQGIFKFGYAVKLEGSNEYNYYCPDRKVWEEIGYFNPLTDPVELKIVEERAKYWLGVGAQPTDTTRALLKKGGVL